MLKKTLSGLAISAFMFATYPAQAQDALPQDIINQLQLACNTDQTETETVEDQDNAGTCASTAATLAQANPDLATQIVAFATQNGASGTGAALAQLMASSTDADIQNQIPEIISAIIANDSENAAEILLTAASAFPEDQQQTILTQLVAQVQSDSPGLLDDTAVAALGIPINPAFSSAAVGLQNLDAVSPD